MSRINLWMTLKDAVISLSEGNPGCIAALTGLINKKEEDAIKYILWFDSYGIYGSKIYMIWNDACDRDFDKFTKTIDALQCGEVPMERLWAGYANGRLRPLINEKED